MSSTTPLRVEIALDLETSGLDVYGEDEIIEIGAHEASSSFEVLVKPSKPICAKVTQLTGITNEMLDEKGIALEEALAQLIQWMTQFEGRDIVLVGHNFINFDMPLLHRCLESIGRGSDFKYVAIIDTLLLMRRSQTHRGSKKLTDLYFEAFPDQEFLQNAHRASADARATLDLYESKWFRDHCPLPHIEMLRNTFQERFKRTSRQAKRKRMRRQSLGSCHKKIKL